MAVMSGKYRISSKTGQKRLFAVKNGSTSQVHALLFPSTMSIAVSKNILERLEKYSIEADEVKNTKIAPRANSGQLAMRWKSMNLGHFLGSIKEICHFPHVEGRFLTKFLCIRI